MCVWLHVCIYTGCMEVPKMAKRAHWTPETGITGTVRC